MTPKIGRRLTDSETQRVAMLAAYIDASPHEWPKGVADIALLCHGYLDLLAELAEARKHAEQYRQNWLALQEVTGEDCQQRAMEVIREARKDGERLATLYETVQIISVPYVLMRLDMPEEAGWDGATCLWTREIFNITIDNATAARGAK